MDINIITDWILHVSYGCVWLELQLPPAIFMHIYTTLTHSKIFLGPPRSLDKLLANSEYPSKP